MSENQTRSFCLACFFLATWTMGSADYFPIASVKINLPKVQTLPRPLPSLLKLRVLDQTTGVEVSSKYGIVDFTIPYLFYIRGNELRLNETWISNGQLSNKLTEIEDESLTISSGDYATCSVLIVFTDQPLDCTSPGLQQQLCFRDVMYQQQDSVLTELAPLSDDFLAALCPVLALSYNLPASNSSVWVTRKRNTNIESWSISSAVQKLGQEIEESFQLNCTVRGSNSSRTFQDDFNINIQEEDKSPIFYFELDYGNKTIPKGVKVGSGIIFDREGGKQKHYEVKLASKENKLSINRSAQELTSGLFPNSTHLEYEFITKESLVQPYDAYVQVLYKSSPVHVHKIELRQRRKTTRSLMQSSPMANSTLLEVLYEREVNVSRYASLGTRVTQPDHVKRLVNLRFLFSLHFAEGIFRITEHGGIIYVADPEMLQNLTQFRMKIGWQHPVNGSTSFHVIAINVMDIERARKCESVEDNSRPSCSMKRNLRECVNTCGASSGQLRYKDGNGSTIGCEWQKAKDPMNNNHLNRAYTTCSADLTTCPDQYCDPLETLYRKTCPQDCATNVIGLATKDDDSPGISAASGICSCFTEDKCICTTPTGKAQQKTGEVTTTPRDYDIIISPVPIGEDGICGHVCKMSLIGASLILFLVGIGISTIILLRHRRRRKRCPNESNSIKEDRNMNYEDYVDRPMAPAQSGVSEKPEFYDKKWEFPRHRLTIEETIGEGEFGRVLKARAEGICGSDGSAVVAVKTLKANAKETELADLVSEYQLLKEVDHPNVIHLLGACTTTDGPVYIIIEYAEHGALRNYLRRNRQFGSDKHLDGKDEETSYMESITPKDILTFAWQIAKGMAYLTDMKLVHRDLATRNVLLGDGLICKISDFGLTRDIYEDDTYLKRSRGRVPVKWMALESLADHIYTTKSDVWSYGVVLWELVTTGSSPYPGVAVQNLFHLLKNGYRMEKPPNCSHELYAILRSCWQENPQHRPTFKTLVVKLEEMLSEGKEYLDLNPRIIENKTYFTDFCNETDEQKELFLPVTGAEVAPVSGSVVKWRFEFAEPPEKLKTCSCPPKKCICDVILRYENENVGKKPKYENEEIMENSYVEPSSDPKPVNCTVSINNETPDTAVEIKPISEIIGLSHSNLYVETKKAEMVDKKI